MDRAADATHQFIYFAFNRYCSGDKLKELDHGMTYFVEMLIGLFIEGFEQFLIQINARWCCCLKRRLFFLSRGNWNSTDMGTDLIHGCLQAGIIKRATCTDKLAVLLNGIHTAVQGAEHRRIQQHFILLHVFQRRFQAGSQLGQAANA